MFGNLGFHTDIFTPISIVLLIIGAVLGYGGKYIVGKVAKNPSDKAAVAVKLIGLTLVAAGAIIIFTR